MNSTDPRLEGKTFVCGVGVQKAGTTWLHNYLAGRGDILMSKKKELHYFDAIYAEEMKTDYRNRLRRRSVRQLKLTHPEDPPNRHRRLLQLLELYRMFIDDDGYAEYFARRAGELKCFGEITPSYCMIGDAGFAHMRRLFPRVKIIYLMRDPIERHYSSARMAVGRNGAGRSAEDFFMLRLEHAFSRGMADYKSHLESLRKVFSADELFIGFYENLFNDAEIRRLCDFLGVPFMPGDYGLKSFQSVEGQGLTPEMIKTARKAFDGVYSYCRETLPGVPKSWRFDV